MLRTIELTAPHGSRLAPTVYGVQIQFDDSKKGEVVKWLLDTAKQLEDRVDSDLVTCPRCGGTPKIVGEQVQICPLCKGQYRVTKQTAIEYATALGIVVTMTANLPPAPKGEPVIEAPFIGPIYDPELAGQPPIGPIYDPELAGQPPIGPIYAPELAGKGGTPTE